MYNGLTSVCPSAGYYQDETFAVVAEVLDRYGLSGFFFNWLTYNEHDYSRRYRGVCQCAACGRRFAQLAPGVQLPVGPESDSYDEWRRFADDSLEELTLRMRNHIAALAPEAMFVQGTSADVLFHEANNAVGRPLWHVRTAEQVSAARTARPDTPVLVNSVAFVDMPYRLAGEDPHHFAQFLVQAISRGASPSTYIMGGPRDSPYACLDIAGELTRFHRHHTDVYRDLVPAARTLLVRPDALRRVPTPTSSQSRSSRGLSVALLERHVPFDVVDERQLAALPDDDGHRMIIVPNLGPLESARWHVSNVPSWLAPPSSRPAPSHRSWDRPWSACSPDSTRSRSCCLSTSAEWTRAATGGPSRLPSWAPSTSWCPAATPKRRCP